MIICRAITSQVLMARDGSQPPVGILTMTAVVALTVTAIPA
jgi:hypothetical protein